MNVVVDALSSRIGGGQTYLRNLVAHDVPIDDVKVHVLAPSSLDLPRLGSGIQRIRVRESGVRPLGRALWIRLVLPRLLRDLGTDVLFTPGGTSWSRPLARVRTVTMFRNMLPFDDEARALYPPGYIRLRLELLRAVMLRSMSTADLVIFVSEYARRLVTARFPGRIRQTAVIPHGVGKEFHPATAGLSRPAWLPDEYIAYVSNIEPYKAQLEVIRAFALLRRDATVTEKLLLVGPPSSPHYARRLTNEVRRLRLDDAVVFTGAVPHEELPAVYGSARVVVFASRCENCPNVLLEALAAGRPLAVSNREPMPEFAGPGALYFDPLSPDDIAVQVGRLLRDPQRAATTAREAAGMAARYDWQDTAQRTWQEIHALGAGLGMPRHAP